MTITKIAVVSATMAMLATAFVGAQRTFGGFWVTSDADPQRTGWVPSDAFISVKTLTDDPAGFKAQWKVKTDNGARGMTALNQGVTITGLNLFTPGSYVSGSSNNFYMFDDDTGNIMWSRKIDAPIAGAPTLECPGGVSGSMARMGPVTPPAAPAARGGGRGDRGGYTSAVGDPGTGVPPLPGRGPARGDPPPGGTVPVVGLASFSPIPDPPMTPIFSVASNGIMYFLGAASGLDLTRPAPFVPANARVSDLVAVDNMVYAATMNGCGGVPNGIWAMDVQSAVKTVVSWRTNGGSPVGGVTVAPNGTILATIGPSRLPSSATSFSNAVVSLDPKTLQLKDWFTMPNANFATAPMVFAHGSRDVVAVATKDGRVVLLDAASLGGADHATPLLASPAYSAAKTDYASPGLATWVEALAADAPPTLTGTRWIVLPVATPASTLPMSHGPAPNGALVGLEVGDAGGKPTLTPTWVSRDLTSPSMPIVLNGVVFGLSRGIYHPASGTVAVAERVRRSTPAVLYAFDATTGREVWNSGKEITSFVPGRSLWTSAGQVFVGTHDSTVYAFGYAMERFN